MKNKIVMLIIWLLVLGIIESICAVLNAELKTYLIFLLLALISYTLSYELF
mgnify:CR=1 FL=1|nr:MAG TPA: hypothetical protein [Bacteriophage sp.]